MANSKKMTRSGFFARESDNKLDQYTNQNIVQTLPTFKEATRHKKATSKQPLSTAINLESDAFKSTRRSVSKIPTVRLS